MIRDSGKFNPGRAYSCFNESGMALDLPSIFGASAREPSVARAINLNIGFNGPR